jgi:tetratricopeptide (TPR) repeat protein
MALANVAWILAATGFRVLTIDWDLEAPGLHRYFRPFLRDPELASSKGLIDLFWEYSDLMLSPKTNWPAGLEDLKIFADPYRYIIPLEWRLAEDAGCVHFLAAGLQDAGYGSRVRDFDWRAFYERLGGNAFIDSFRDRLKYDFVLIDSRTGVADTSGICTLQLPDQIVVCFTYNRLSIKGAEAVAASIMARGQRKIALTFVATRVEKGVSTIERAREFARDRLDRLLPVEWSVNERDTYWSNCETAYYPEYAFEETISMFREVATQRAGPLADMNWIASQILGTGSITPPRVSPDMRQRYLRRIAFQDPRRAELDELLKQRAPSAGNTRVRELITDTLKSGELDGEYCKALVGAALTVASRLREIGEIEPALSLARDAVELQRRSIIQPIEAGTADLGRALTTLSVYLSDVGRREPALGAVEEAVTIFRDLAGQRLDAAARVEHHLTIIEPHQGAAQLRICTDAIEARERLRDEDQVGIVDAALAESAVEPVAFVRAK